MENDILNIKKVLAYLLTNEPYSEAEILNLKQAIKDLGLRLDATVDPHNPRRLTR